MGNLVRLWRKKTPLNTYQPAHTHQQNLKNIHTNILKNKQTHINTHTHVNGDYPAMLIPGTHSAWTVRCGYYLRLLNSLWKWYCWLVTEKVLVDFLFDLKNKKKCYKVSILYLLLMCRFLFYFVSSYFHFFAKNAAQENIQKRTQI